MRQDTEVRISGFAHDQIPILYVQYSTGTTPSCPVAGLPPSAYLLILERIGDYVDLWCNVGVEDIMTNSQLLRTLHPPPRSLMHDIYTTPSPFPSPQGPDASRAQAR